jgi:ADP-heptose:LPS heptosyltransferase
MFPHLQILYPRERLAVGLADLALAAVAAGARIVERRATTPPARILLLRLERIGDLLMSAAAIEAVRTMAPQATIDLVVGSWNADVAACLQGLDHVETLDAPWLARGADALSGAALAKRAWQWRARRYDLAINFEGDIRSHALMALGGAPVRVGFDMAGGGPLLTRRVAHDPTMHTAVNAAHLVEAAFDRPAPAAHQPFRLRVPEAARARAATLLNGDGIESRPRFPSLIALHASGGRAIKQWDVERFTAAAARLATTHAATLVLTGAPGDAPLVAQVKAGLAALPVAAPVIDVSGRIDLLTLAAVLERCALLVTGDTGPMHLAAAVGTPVAAVFGPSDPARYAPRGAPHRVVRIDLWCAPCNRIRLPPQRCQGHTPDCLAGVTVDAVCAAGEALLLEAQERSSAAAQQRNAAGSRDAGERR